MVFLPRCVMTLRQCLMWPGFLPTARTERRCCQLRACPGPGRSVNACTWRGLMTVKCRWSSVAIPVSPRALGDGRHSGTGDARRKIKISLRESGHAADAGALESGGLEPVTAGRPQEGHLSLRSRPRLEKVPDLAQDRRRHQQRAFRMPQEAEGMPGGRDP